MTLLRPVTAHKEKETKRLYRQCQLRRLEHVQVAYIPKEFAIKGDVVKIKADGEWIDGWKVEEVWKEVDEAFLEGMRNAVKHHADVSDI